VVEKRKISAADLNPVDVKLLTRKCVFSEIPSKEFPFHYLYRDSLKTHEAGIQVKSSVA
jgi:hypothetical protein